MMGTFEESEEERLLRKLATEYHRRCESYDRTVCSGMRDGIAMPTNGRELGEINRHAHKVWSELSLIADANGLSKERLLRAIQRYA